MNPLCYQIYITGRVQGVWYRASAQDKAHSLNITGWARNLPDGRVEVRACGPEPALETFITWLKKGPPMARVKTVTVTPIPWEAFKTFETR